MQTIFLGLTEWKVRPFWDLGILNYIAYSHASQLVSDLEAGKIPAAARLAILADDLDVVDLVLRAIPEDQVPQDIVVVTHTLERVSSYIPSHLILEVRVTDDPHCIPHG